MTVFTLTLNLNNSNLVINTLITLSQSASKRKIISQLAYNLEVGEILPSIESTMMNHARRMVLSGTCPV